MNTRLTCCCTLLCISIAATASAQQNTQRGAILGGLFGAATGAAIGDHNDEAGAGALIGAAIGTVTGAALGNTADQEQQRQRAAAAYQQQVRLSRAVSPHDVITMSHNGLGDLVIINHIRENGVQRRIEVADVIALHQQGVSDPVITAMQQAPVGGYTAAPQPVIVQERYVPTPVYVRPAPRYYHHPHYYHHHHYHGHRRYPSSGWGFHIHN